MTFIAIQEQLDGKVVDWMEQVTDEQCGHQVQRRSLEESEAAAGRSRSRPT
jgi:hypothetical protein